ncbi:MAG: sulfotransferase family protein [Myxococcota bacterium]
MPGDPIFIIGTERSGSNLVRLLLNSHPNVAVPHPPHIVRYFAPLEPAYGDLSRDDAFARLVDDVLALLDAHIYAWEIPVDRDRIVREARPRDAFGVYVALYDQYAEAKGKPRWGCKSTFMVHEIDRIMARFSGAKLLFLVRDPRDVCVSAKKSVFSHFHPYYTAQLWRDEQRKGIAALDALPAENILLVRYEELTTDAEAQVRRICDFVGEPFDPRMLKFFETDEAKKSASLSESWANTAKPVKSDSVGQFHNSLTAQEIALVEHVCRAEMARLGYAPVTPAAELDAMKVSPIDSARWWVAEQAQALRVEARSVMKDKNVLQRWSRAMLLRRLRMRAAFATLSHAHAR